MRATLPAEARNGDDLLARLGLLIGQSFFLGLTLGLVIISGYSLLLAGFGAGAFPYVYIVVAILGSLAFYGFGELQQRFSLVQISIVTEIIIVIFLALTWAGLVFAQATWLAFAVMVSFSLIVQIGFVILGGQAGRLLDVRLIKRYFPRIVAGFVVGFMVAGALVSPLQRLLGSTENLILVAGISALIMLGMLLATNMRYRQILTQASSSGPQIKAPPLRKVLVKRFVLLIVSYQMLSAIVTQLLEFLVVSAAGQRFSDSTALASFFGTYTFILNLTDLLFLALIAGSLMTHFGLRFGLSANPGIDILILIPIVVVGVIVGQTAAIFFWMVITARLVDITFTDGTTRTSINAAFQALPAHERVTVQTGVEGIGVPLALGITGVILLIFEALGNVTLVHTAAFTFLISLLWMGSALLVYRDYGSNLLKNMRRRTLNPVDLAMGDHTSQEVTNRLLASDKISDVRLALDVLQGAEDPSLDGHLVALLASKSDLIQIEALKRIEKLNLQKALPEVVELLARPSSARVHGAALQTFCALQEADAVEMVAPYLDKSDTDLRLGAAVGLLRYGSIPGILAVGRRLESWEQSRDAADRRFLAQVIGKVAQPAVYQPLITLLADPDLEVRRAALAAAGQVKHPRLLPPVVGAMADRSTRSDAVDALAAYGSRILPLVKAALLGDATLSKETVRLVRACGRVPGPEVVALLRDHIDHPSNRVRDQILTILASRGFQGQADELALLNNTLKRDVSFGYQLLLAEQDIGEGVSVEPLRRALVEESSMVKKRIFWILSFLYDAETISRAQAQLQKGSSSEQAVVMELLSITLAAAHQALTFPLIDPKLDTERRIQLLNKQFPLPRLRRDERLQDLSRNYGQGWIRACALYAAAQSGSEWMLSTIESALGDNDPVVRETAVWGLFNLAPERFAEKKESLLADEDRHVVRVTAALAN